MIFTIFGCFTGERVHRAHCTAILKVISFHVSFLFPHPKAPGPVLATHLGSTRRSWCLVILKIGHKSELPHEDIKTTDLELDSTSKTIISKSFFWEGSARFSVQMKSNIKLHTL